MEGRLLCSALTLTWLLISVADLPSQGVTLFQVIDHSHLALWINWWVVALETQAIPSNWNLHIACFGGPGLDAIIRSYHSEGCTYIDSSGIHLTRIYYAKALALTKALRLGRDLLSMDVDALLVTDPSSLWSLADSANDGRKYDIISSRDTGPVKLPHAQHWGSHRLCTGAIYFRYSQNLMDFMEYVLMRCKQYGHDQIQLNTALSMTGVVWEKSKDVMQSEEHSEQDFKGFFAWPWSKSVSQGARLGFDMSNEKWHESNDAQREIVESSLRDVPIGTSMSGTTALTRRKLHIHLLSPSTVLRYCNRAAYDLNGRKIENAMPITLSSKQPPVALHCHYDEGPQGEQGSMKKEMKVMVMVAMHMWLLRDEFTFSSASMMWAMHRNDSNLMSGKTHPSNKLVLQRYRDERRLADFRSVWLSRNESYLETLTNPLKELIKRGFFASKLGVAPVDSASAAEGGGRRRQKRPRLEPEVK